MEEIKLPHWLDSDRVISQVTSEYQASVDFVNDKRDLFRERESIHG